MLAANGGALFYFDTASYVERGQEVLALVGVDMPPLAAPVRDDLGGPPEPAPDPGAPDTPETVDGSRSMVYSLLVGLFLWAGALEGLVVLNAALAVAATWLAARVALREAGAGPAQGMSPGVATLLALLPALLGSLPFYVAFLMPDILAPVLLLVAATLAAFAPRMRPWELALAWGLGALAVTTHLSHLAIGLLLVPLVGLAAFLVGGPRRWLAPLAMAAIAAAGVAEQGLLRVAAEVAEDAEVVYRPFLTARLIQDGPGLAYLEENCPDEAIPTCPLLDALGASDDPERLTATSISFDTSPGRGSFRLLPAADQLAIAQGQFDFALDVLRDRPLGTAWAFLRNVLRQLALNSVDMTLQTNPIVARAEDLPGLALGGFRHGRLTEARGWLAVADPAQALLYAASAVALLALALRRRTPARLRAFLLMVGVGVLVNALVCGGLSQPASRYGARVMWLLPTAAALGALALRGRAPRAADPGFSTWQGRA